MIRHMREDCREVKYEDFVLMYVRLVPGARVCGRCKGCEAVTVDRASSQRPQTAPLGDPSVTNDEVRHVGQAPLPLPPSHARAIAGAASSTGSRLAVDEKQCARDQS